MSVRPWVLFSGAKCYVAHEGRCTLSRLVRAPIDHPHPCARALLVVSRAGVGDAYAVNSMGCDCRMRSCANSM